MALNKTIFIDLNNYTLKYFIQLNDKSQTCVYMVIIAKYNFQEEVQLVAKILGVFFQ